MKTTCYVSQGFGQNFNTSYTQGGLKGHTGVDEFCGYGSDVHSYYDGYVYKVLNDSHPSRDGSGFWGVFIIVENELGCFEFLVGHCSEIFVKEGDYVSAGQVIGKEGNHGLIYISATEQITKEMQDKGDHRGSHRHDQKRVLIKDKTFRTDLMALDSYDESPFKKDDFYYFIYNYQNGYNGCVDFTVPLWNQNMVIGQSSYDVLRLQYALAREGVFSHEPTGYFGFVTLKAVRDFQLKYNINPALGFAGPLTRGKLLDLYKHNG